MDCPALRSSQDFGFDIPMWFYATAWGIDPAGCAYTSYCSGRVFMSVTKAF